MTCSVGKTLKERSPAGANTSPARTASATAAAANTGHHPAARIVAWQGRQSLLAAALQVSPPHTALLTISCFSCCSGDTIPRRSSIRFKVSRCRRSSAQLRTSGNSNWGTRQSAADSHHVFKSATCGHGVGMAWCDREKCLHASILGLRNSGVCVRNRRGTLGFSSRCCSSRCSSQSTWVFSTSTGLQAPGFTYSFASVQVLKRR